eukprot:scaffold11901_cov96-Isochrysis_galbana.AAC.6
MSVGFLGPPEPLPTAEGPVPPPAPPPGGRGGLMPREVRLAPEVIKRGPPPLPPPLEPRLAVPQHAVVWATAGANCAAEPSETSPEGADDSVKAGAGAAAPAFEAAATYMSSAA